MQNDSLSVKIYMYKKKELNNKLKTTNFLKQTSIYLLFIYN